MYFCVVCYTIQSFCQEYQLWERERICTKLQVIYENVLKLWWNVKHASNKNVLVHAQPEIDY